MPSVIVGERCHHCQRFFNPAEVPQLPGGARICEGCQETFVAGLTGLNEFVQGKVGCPVCRKSKEEMNILYGGEDIPMYLHRMDGTVVPMCEACHSQIVPKMVQQFRGTAFGEALKL